MDLKKVLERLETIERMQLTVIGALGFSVGNEAVKTEIRQLQRDIEQHLIRTTGTV